MSVRDQMSYQVDGDNDKKQIPKGRPVGAYGRAFAPAPKAITDRPNYVVINGRGSYAFAYQSGSLDTYTTGSFLDDAAGPYRLDINPVAWYKTDGAGIAGDITFVYTGDVG